MSKNGTKNRNKSGLKRKKVCGSKKKGGAPNPFALNPLDKPTGMNISPSTSRAARTSRHQFLAEQKEARRLEELAIKEREEQEKLQRAERRAFLAAQREQERKEREESERIRRQSAHSQAFQQHQQRSQNFYANRPRIVNGIWYSLFEQPLASLAHLLNLQLSDIPLSLRQTQIFHAVNDQYLQIFNSNNIFGGYDKELRKILTQKYYNPVSNFFVLLGYYKRKVEEGIPVSARVRQRLLALAEKYRGQIDYIDPELLHFLNTHIIQAGLPTDNVILDEQDAELAQLLVQLSIS